MTAKERPVLFSAPMVRAILDGRKTQTRRVVKPLHSYSIEERDDGSMWPWYPDYVTGGEWDGWVPCPFGAPRDWLWVRETFAMESAVEGRNQPLPHNDQRPVQYGPDDDVFGVSPGWIQPHYRATDPAPDLTCEREGCRQCRESGMGPHWRPSIHMPRWASRILLEVTSVRVERLQAISEADACAEGIERNQEGRWTDYMNEGFGGYFDHPRVGARFSYASLWDSINGRGAWDANPWIWAISFRRIEPSPPSS